MENVKSYIVVGMLVLAMVTSAGVIAYFVLNSIFADKIDKRFNELEINFRHKIQNCSKMTISGDSNRTDNAIDIDMGTVELENSTTCEKTESQRYITLCFKRKIDTLENGKSALFVCCTLF